MKLASFYHNNLPGFGVVLEDEVIDLSHNHVTDLGTYLAGAHPGPFLWQQDMSPFPRVPLAQVRWRAPIPLPPKVSAVGLNYYEHAAEQSKQPPKQPMFFAKSRTCVVGPDDPIVLPPGRPEIDVEVELAVVFARRAERVKAERALDCVLGFTLFNDVSDRQSQREDRQFYRGKSWPSFGPSGPWVITPDEFDHTRGAIRLWRSGFLQQESDLSQLVHKVETLIELLSDFLTIEPGDLLATGTPGGVGVYRDPPVFLAPGDTIELEIEGLGRLSNPVTAL